MSDPVVVAELKHLAEENGGLLRPSQIVEAARAETSPLHKHFEWDDTEAAQGYRMWQARQLLRVTVQYHGTGDEAVSHRVFVSLKSDRQQPGGGYRVTTEVMMNPQQHQQLLTQAMDDIRYFKKKYAVLQELSGILTEMDKVQNTKAAA